MGCPQRCQGPTTLSLPWMMAYCHLTRRSARWIKVARCLIAPPTIGGAGRRCLTSLTRELTLDSHPECGALIMQSGAELRAVMLRSPSPALDPLSGERGPG